MTALRRQAEYGGGPVTMTSAERARIEALAARMETFLTEAPRFFVELVALTPEGQYRDVLRAWGHVRERVQLERDDEGRYVIPAASSATGKATA